MLKWLPWRYVVRHLAKANGFIDPISLHAQLQKFSQPAEVAEPVELLRAGVVFHARGLLNSKVIQHNLDWVWPYWVERQCDPEDISFLPRAFSITQINLTHRNWTGIGYPDCEHLPVIDPRGLCTPFWDGWSIDVWIIKDDGTQLIPSRQEHSTQSLKCEEGLAVETRFSDAGMDLSLHAFVEMTNEGPQCVLNCRGTSPEDGWLVISARPYNPEGISLIDDIKLSADRKTWTINSTDQVEFSHPIERHHTSNYHDGDVFIHLNEKDDVEAQHCPVGVVTAAAMFKLSANTEKSVTVSTSLLKHDAKEPEHKGHIANKPPLQQGVTNEHAWSEALREAGTITLADEKVSNLYESGVATLVMCTPSEVFAGPYTYKRYWYRDAVFIGYGLLQAGLRSRAGDIVRRFPERQQANGYYHSQEGEWDSNGQVLWLTDLYFKSTTDTIDAQLWQTIKKGAEWIIDKRLTEDTDEPWAGLLPAGFSAEHLGPNDYYYWDNYWAIAGLQGAANIALSMDEAETAQRYEEYANALSESVQISLHKWTDKHNKVAIPASPMRRMDAGAIGSIVTGYPLQLCTADDEALNNTVEHLIANSFCQNGFFQDMIHSGINIYLTLQIAQVLLRKGDPRFQDLMNACSKLASSTGMWPEAVHPHTHGGCMGDGHHAWAAAEWVSMVRNCFVFEDDNQLIVGAGVIPAWIENTEASFGPTPTRFGDVTITISQFHPTLDRCSVKVEGDWIGPEPEVLIRLPGYPETVLPDHLRRIEIEKVKPAETAEVVEAAE